MRFLDRLQRKRDSLPTGKTTDKPLAAGELATGATTERGHRANPDNDWLQFQRRLWVDPRLLATIRDIRAMDACDGRVKKIHSRSARAAAKGGIRLVATGQPRLEREWRLFSSRLGLNNPQKLQSDLRGILTDGNLAIQWVLDEQDSVAAAPRMPPETLVPQVNRAGVFDNPAAAYEQLDLLSGQAVAKFALWQLTVGRLDPVNFDDWGCPGRPYLDASRSCWRKLDMTEEDAVLRRHMRAPQRMAHVLEGASVDEITEYRTQVENDQGSGSIRDYYLNRKGSVAPIQGDANLEQIADVVHLLDTFLSGAPMSKPLLGYAGDLSRDILEDLKKDWYDELAAIQTVAASVYRQGFVLHLLLKGINPLSHEFDVAFAERLTDTPNQRADLALKIQALGASQETVFETAGLNATAEIKAVERARRDLDPYPEDVEEDGDGEGAAPPQRGPGGTPRVSVTPGNARKGESATTISTRNGG